jgi:NADH:ubiquinone oxidoreductase subunit F (NADH-binding)
MKVRSLGLILFDKIYKLKLSIVEMGDRVLSSSGWVKRIRALHGELDEKRVGAYLIEMIEECDGGYRAGEEMVREFGGGNSAVAWQGYLDACLNELREPRLPYRELGGSGLG